MLLPIPNVRNRPNYRLNRSTTAAISPGLQGSAMLGSSGGTVLNATTYREIVAVPNATTVRVRLLTVGSTGTLNIKPIAPLALVVTDESATDKNGFIDPLKAVPYATGGATVAVVAATEVKLDLALSGENYVMIEFVCSANGSITWCDVCQLTYT